jgi:hypothetical protein
MGTHLSPQVPLPTENGRHGNAGHVGVAQCARLELDLHAQEAVEDLRLGPRQGERQKGPKAREQHVMINQNICTTPIYRTLVLCQLDDIRQVINAMGMLLLTPPMLNTYSVLA